MTVPVLPNCAAIPRRRCPRPGRPTPLARRRLAPATTPGQVQGMPHPLDTATRARHAVAAIRGSGFQSPESALAADERIPLVVTALRRAVRPVRDGGRRVGAIVPLDPSAVPRPAGRSRPWAGSPTPPWCCWSPGTAWW